MNMTNHASYMQSVIKGHEVLERFLSDQIWHPIEFINKIEEPIFKAIYE